MPKSTTLVSSDDILKIYIKRVDRIQDYLEYRYKGKHVEEVRSAVLVEIDAITSELKDLNRNSGPTSQLE